MNEDVLVLLIPIIAIIMGGLIFLVPIAGWTARFALKPIVEAVARMREAQGATREVQILEQRVALLEQQVQLLEGSVDQIADKREFDRKLSPGG